MLLLGVVLGAPCVSLLGGDNQAATQVVPLIRLQVLWDLFLLPPCDEPHR